MGQVAKRLREGARDDDRPWTPDRLRQILRAKFESRELVIASNREPYSHERVQGGEIAVRTSAGGVVTVLSPLMRACSGTWVAHGSGSADRETVDADDRVRVPPHSPEYVLRRVWLSAEEGKRYYEGFSNEGIWPLCHTTQVHPVFRDIDWATYEQVNRRFADAVAEECRGDRPIIFVQDYHLALLPRLLRAIRPASTVALFWHIPWPGAERLRWCPWWRKIVYDMLQADLIGFNTAEHCHNFMSAVHGLDGTRTDMSTSLISCGTHTCKVSAYAASIEGVPVGASDGAHTSIEVRRRFGIPRTVLLGVSVDRCDPTKGILERLMALEKFFESFPRWCGSFLLLQFVVPSRSNIPAYRALQEATSLAVERINLRFGTLTWKPVVWVREEQKHGYLPALYRSADVCLVTSLHDGMNLVAKEYVSARDDEDGVLILSRNAGAACELGEALLIDPLDISGTGQAINAALCMSREERRARMRSLRKTVERHNVYSWAGRLLLDLADVIRLRPGITQVNTSRTAQKSSR